jgi:O-antigen/teichoic acid export membrane protein
MALQALGHTGKAMISGGVEMLARIVVSRVFVPMFGFSAICFADQSAWVSAAIYTSILIYFFFYKKYRSNQKG